MSQRAIRTTTRQRAGARSNAEPEAVSWLARVRAESFVEAVARRLEVVAAPNQGKNEGRKPSDDRHGLLERIKAQGDDCIMLADEAAYLLGCSESAFRRLHLPSVRLGARLFRWRYAVIRQHVRLLENRAQRGA